MIELDLNWWISSITFGFIKFWLGIVRTFLFIKTISKLKRKAWKQKGDFHFIQVDWFHFKLKFSVSDWKKWIEKFEKANENSNLHFPMFCRWRVLNTRDWPRTSFPWKKGTGDFFHDYWFFGTTEKEGTGIFYTCFNKKWFKSCGSFVILFRWRQLEGWIGSLYQWCF